MCRDVVVAVDPVGGRRDTVGVPDGDGLFGGRGIWVVDLCKNFSYFSGDLGEVVGSNLCRNAHVPDGEVVGVGILASAHSDTNILALDVDVRAVSTAGAGVVADDTQVMSAYDLLSSDLAKCADISAVL